MGTPRQTGRDEAMIRSRYAPLIALSAFALTGCGGGTTYKSSVMNYNVLNPADLTVAVQVTNTGHSAGTPSCTIEASDPSGAYTGFDIATIQGTVAAGEITHFADNIVITHQGAQYVTDVTVTCS
jgi:hypothetical protein